MVPPPSMVAMDPPSTVIPLAPVKVPLVPILLPPLTVTSPAAVTDAPAVVHRFAPLVNLMVFTLVMLVFFFSSGMSRSFDGTLPFFPLIFTLSAVRFLDAYTVPPPVMSIFPAVVSAWAFSLPPAMFMFPPLVSTDPPCMVTVCFPVSMAVLFPPLFLSTSLTPSVLTVMSFSAAMGFSAVMVEGIIVKV